MNIINSNLMKHCLTFTFIFLVILANSTAQEDKQVYGAERLEVGVNMSYTFNLVKQNEEAEISKISVLNKDLFQEDKHQKLKSFVVSHKYTKENDSISVIWEEPEEGTYNYNVKTELISNVRFQKVEKKIDFPIKDLNPEYVKYIQSVGNIDITPEIRRKAREIVGDETDLYRVVDDLSVWVYHNINYTYLPIALDKAHKASWVLEKKAGVCDEKAYLLAALLRSLNIPARVVEGMIYAENEAYSQSWITDNWGLHAWVEVYFPGVGWVSYDPTSNERGYVDATHLKFGELTKNSGGQRYGLARKNAFEASITNITTDIEVDIISKLGHFQTPYEIEMTTLDKVDFGSYNVIEITLTNNNDYYISDHLFLANMNAIKMINSNVIV